MLEDIPTEILPRGKTFRQTDVAMREDIPTERYWHEGRHSDRYMFKWRKTFRLTDVAVNEDIPTGRCCNKGRHSDRQFLQRGKSFSQTDIAIPKDTLTDAFILQIGKTFRQTEYCSAWRHSDRGPNWTRSTSVLQLLNVSRLVKHEGHMRAKTRVGKSLVAV